jgi:large subunit ribosomal protein L13
MKTYLPNATEFERKWVVFDAEEQILGRLAVKIANALRGKDEPTYTPHMDCGKNVIVINADKVKLTGKKETEKTYIGHTGHVGGQTSTTPEEVREKDSTRLVSWAVKGMLDDGRLGRSIFRKLHVYSGAEHPHEAQKPVKAN